MNKEDKYQPEISFHQEHPYFQSLSMPYEILDFILILNSPVGSILFTHRSCSLISLEYKHSKCWLFLLVATAPPPGYNAVARSRHSGNMCQMS